MNDFVAFYQSQLFYSAVLVCTSGMLTTLKLSDEKLALIATASTVPQSTWPS